MGVHHETPIQRGLRKALRAFVGALQSSYMKGFTQLLGDSDGLYKTPRASVRLCGSILQFQGNVGYFPVSSFSKGIPTFYIDSSEWHFYANSIIAITTKSIEVSLKFVTYLINKNATVSLVISCICTNLSTYSIIFALVHTYRVVCICTQADFSFKLS